MAAVRLAAGPPRLTGSKGIRSRMNSQMTESDLRRCKDVLEREAARLERRLRRQEDIAIERVPEEIDAGQFAAERDLAIRGMERETALLREMRAALERIEDGAYGLCLNCGEEIRRVRLLAVPWAALCIGCQEAVELEAGAASGTEVTRLDEAA